MLTTDEKLAIALDKLREIAGACERCNGTGALPSCLEARLMTSDPRYIGEPMRSWHGRVRRAAVYRLRRVGPEVLDNVVALVSGPCDACWHIRQVIKKAQGF